MIRLLWFSVFVAQTQFYGSSTYATSFKIFVKLHLCLEYFYKTVPLWYMYMYGLGSHFPIKLETIGEMEGFEMFTFGQTGHVGTLYASISFFCQNIMFGEMICNMLGTRVNRYSDQQKSFLFSKTVHIMYFVYICHNQVSHNIDFGWRPKQSTKIY